MNFKVIILLSHNTLIWKQRKMIFHRMKKPFLIK
jgi:hypothetical protein